MGQEGLQGSGPAQQASLEFIFRGKKQFRVYFSRKGWKKHTIRPKSAQGLHITCTQGAQGSGFRVQGSGCCRFAELSRWCEGKPPSSGWATFHTQARSCAASIPTPTDPENSLLGLRGSFLSRGGSSTPSGTTSAFVSIAPSMLRYLVCKMRG